MWEDDGPFPPSHPFSSSSSIVDGPFEMMKMMTEEELVAAAAAAAAAVAAAAAASESALQSSPKTRQRRRGQQQGGGRGGGGGGDGEGWQPWQMGWGIPAIAVDCGRGAEKRHFLDAPVRRGKERQGKRHGEGTSVATTSNLLGIVVRQGGCNREEMRRQGQWGEG
jgi:hypothetical protein